VTGLVVVGVASLAAAADRRTARIPRAIGAVRCDVTRAIAADALGAEEQIATHSHERILRPYK
jgi:hypothetical protein